MKKHHLLMIVAGVVVGLAALILTASGNPANMGFCIACFLRDIAGGLGLHSAGKVQYIRPEIIGLTLGAFGMAFAGKEFRARAGSAPALRFLLGALVIIGALNWCAIGIFQFDAVAWLFGGQAAIISRVIYTLVALAGVWTISLLFREEPDSSRIRD